MLIIEGPDLVGKTTLALACQKILASKGYAHVYQHFTKLPEAFDQFLDYLPHIRRNVVQDRFHMSREAYGRALGNQAVNSLLEIQLIDARIRMQGGMTVIVSASERFIRHQWQSKDRDEMYKLDDVIKVMKEYDRIHAQGDFDVDHYFIADEGWPSPEFVVSEYLRKQNALTELNARAVRNQTWSDAFIG